MLCRLGITPSGAKILELPFMRLLRRARNPTCQACACVMCKHVVTHAGQLLTRANTCQAKCRHVVPYAECSWPRGSCARHALAMPCAPYSTCYYSHNKEDNRDS